MRLIDCKENERLLAAAASEAAAWGRALTANLLRIVRGAGAPYELLNQIACFQDAMRRHYELGGHWPIEDVVDSLRRPNPAPGDELLAAQEGVVAGVLQVVASDLVRQRPQRARGEGQMLDGMREHERLMAARRRKYGVPDQAALDEEFAAWCAKHGI